MKWLTTFLLWLLPHCTLCKQPCAYYPHRFGGRRGSWETRLCEPCHFGHRLLRCGKWHRQYRWPVRPMGRAA